MTSSRLIPHFFDISQASLSNSTASLDGNKSEISPNAIPNILALPAILPAVLSLPANVVALLGPNDFPDFPLGFPPDFGVVPLGFGAVTLGFTSGLTPGFGVVPSGFGASSYFHPPHLKVDPDGGGAAGGAVNVVLAIDPALAFTLKVRAGAEDAAAPVPAFAFALKATGGVGDAVATGAGAAVALGVTPSHLKVAPDFGAEGRAVNNFPVLTFAHLGAVAGSEGSAVGAPYFHPSHLEVDPNFGAEGRAVNVPEVALAFTLGAAADSVAVAAGGVAVEALGEALAALAALSLAALY